MAHAKFCIILTLIVLLVAGGIVHAQASMPGSGDTVHADAHTHHSHTHHVPTTTSDSGHGHDHHAGDCSLCANCLAATVTDGQPTPVPMARKQMAINVGSPPRHIPDPLLRPPRSLV